jgi:uncharacterized protein (DUF488 family)
MFIEPVSPKPSERNEGSALLCWSSLRYLCVPGVSAVNLVAKTLTAEAQRTLS